MKISAIKFENFNYRLNKTNTFQTCPIGLKGDTVEFSKNVSFGTNLKSEEEILKLSEKARELADLVIDELPEELDQARCELEQAESVWEFYVQPTLKNEGVVFYTTSDIFGDSIKGFVEKDENKTHIKEYKNGDLHTETIKDKSSITYRNYAGHDNDDYDEWVFALDGELKSVSRGISEKYGVKEIYAKRTFVNGKLDRLQRGIKEEKGRRVKMGSELELMSGRIVCYCGWITISQDEITHIKDKFHFDGNNARFSYIQDEVSGLGWLTSALEIIYEDNQIAQYRKGRFSNSSGEGDEQLSWFKNGKLYKTRGQE